MSMNRKKIKWKETKDNLICKHFPTSLADKIDIGLNVRVNTAELC